MSTRSVEARTRVADRCVALRAPRAGRPTRSRGLIRVPQRGRGPQPARARQRPVRLSLTLIPLVSKAAERRCAASSRSPYPEFLIRDPREGFDPHVASRRASALSRSSRSGSTRANQRYRIRPDPSVRLIPVFARLHPTASVPVLERAWLSSRLAFIMDGARGANLVSGDAEKRVSGHPVRRARRAACRHASSWYRASARVRGRHWFAAPDAAARGLAALFTLAQVGRRVPCKRGRGDREIPFG